MRPHIKPQHRRKKKTSEHICKWSALSSRHVTIMKLAPMHFLIFQQCILRRVRSLGYCLRKRGLRPFIVQIRARRCCTGASSTYWLRVVYADDDDGRQRWRWDLAANWPILVFNFFQFGFDERNLARYC